MSGQDARSAAQDQGEPKLSYGGIFPDAEERYKKLREGASAASPSPRELIDPDGEGIYLHEDQGFPGVLMRAALLFFGDMRKWQDVEQRTVYMRPGEDDHWVSTGIGRWPYGWKLNLPKRIFPVEVYVYCTPNPEAL